jgi:hypothetical protein
MGNVITWKIADDKTETGEIATLFEASGGRLPPVTEAEQGTDTLRSPSGSQPF